MAAQPELTTEIEDTLKRYLAIQAEERRLREEKRSLQEALMAHLAGLEGDYWNPVLAGERLVVHYTRSVEIEYDEELLRKRLGDRYGRILKPDLKKLKAHLAEVESCLEPVLDAVGSPHPDRVRSAILSGLVSKEEFRGAFAKTEKRRLAVGRDRERQERGR